MINWRNLTAGAAVLAMAVPASAAGYLKIPDIKGESELANAGVEPDEIDNKVSEAAQRQKKKDSGEAHLDYLVITMERAQGHEIAHVVQQRAGAVEPSAAVPEANDGGKRAVGPVRWMAPESMRASTRDAASGLATGKRQHKPLTVTKEIDKASPALRSTGANSFLPPRGMSGAGSVALPAALPGCTVGARYPHAIVGDEGGSEVTLLNVSVAACATEEVTLNFEKIRPVD